MKQKLMKGARDLKILFLAEFVRFLFSLLTHRKDNKKFLKSEPTFSPPPLWLAYDAYGHTNWRWYNETGLQHASFFSELILKHTKSSDLKVLDWGCGPGRLVRHMPKLLESRKGVIYASDYNPTTINWIQSVLKEVQFLQNGLAPPLNFESNYFDAVYSVSVLTHLSEAMHFAWVAELHRVLKPGGVLILTTHGDAHRHKLLRHEKELYDKDHLVVRDGVKEGIRWYTAFQPPKFVKEKLFKDWVLLEHLTDLSQDVWVFKRF